MLTTDYSDKYMYTCFSIDKNHRTVKGFTLVELSIVIVIIGLIIAGVVAGQSIVRQAKLRSVISEVNEYNVAMNAFILEYDGLPGDFNRATSYWPSGGTSDGNGDKIIHVQSPNVNTEAIRGWEHLSLAGIIPGSFSGDGNLEIGVNVPASSIDNKTIYLMANLDISLPGTTLFGKSRELIIYTGTELGTNIPWGASFAPKEAKAIDDKIDDGIPSLGIFIAGEGGDYTPYGTHCVDAPWNAGYNPNASYLLNITTKSCRVYFIIGR